MRIVSGLARGIRLAVPPGGGVRPTEDKVKESLFGTLGDLRGASVLDLFSGSGALGLEALSRGAARVVMVERSPGHAVVIHENLSAVLKSMAPNPAGKATLRVEDARRCAERLPEGESFDVILADPPYHTGEGDYGARELLLDERWMRFTHPGTILALEHATEIRNLPWAPNSRWRLLKERTFGIRTISYATLDDGT